VAYGKMIFCREQVTTKTLFAVSLFPGPRENDLHRKFKTNF
jgi:hypothetical protein